MIFPSNLFTIRKAIDFPILILSKHRFWVPALISQDIFPVRVRHFLTSNHGCCSWLLKLELLQYFCPSQHPRASSFFLMVQRRFPFRSIRFTSLLPFLS
ncbi:hypothetical protein QL285_072359 [Trifolium repens]|nr:hypothetical protein QL285_072359 [Trifolium repens]